MKKTALMVLALIAITAVAAMAQGPFTDVPTDHWAYDAINTLQKDGILIGYPDGTYAGKRTITRYEFATALARLAATIPGNVNNPKDPDLSKLATKEELKAAIAGIQIPSIANLATKADVDALKKLIDEFRDEIAALGVDVDALKRDVAALSARVDAIEAEMKRVRFTGDVTVFTVATSSRRGETMDADSRTTAEGTPLLRNVAVVKDFDLKIVGRINDNTTAFATINYGNYLNYLGYVDSFAGGTRATDKAADGAASLKNSLSDTFFPYYLAVNTGLGKGDLTVGRFPLQFTPYTLKKVDVDSYTSILKTDDGNYPVDGAKLGYNFGGVDLTLFAVKNDSNDFLHYGLAGPDKGLIQMVTGKAVGGLSAVTQSAGARATVGVFGGTLGATYYQAWDKSAYEAANPYDQARVYGADLAIGLPWVNTLAFAGSWTQSDTLTREGVEHDVDYGNIAWDGKLTATIFNSVGIGAGYKSIGRNFAAAGAWDKIGSWVNPTNIKGPYADVAFSILSNVKLNLNGEFLKFKDDFSTGDFSAARDDKLTKAEADLRWAFSKTNSLDASYEWVQFDPEVGEKATESYLTIGLSHQMSPNAGLRVGYQFIGYTEDGAGESVSNDYRGGLGVVQMGVSF